MGKGLRVKSTSHSFGGPLYLTDDLMDEIAYFCKLPKKEAKRRLLNGEELQSQVTDVKYSLVKD